MLSSYFGLFYFFIKQGVWLGLAYAFFIQAEHQPLAETCLPGNKAHGRQSPSADWIYTQLAQF